MPCFQMISAPPPFCSVVWCNIQYIISIKYVITESLKQPIEAVRGTQYQLLNAWGGGVDLAIPMMSVNQAATITTGWTGGGVNIKGTDRWLYIKWSEYGLISPLLSSFKSCACLSLHLLLKRTILIIMHCIRGKCHCIIVNIIVILWWTEPEVLRFRLVQCFLYTNPIVCYRHKVSVYM